MQNWHLHECWKQPYGVVGRANFRKRMAESKHPYRLCDLHNFSGYTSSLLKGACFLKESPGETDVVIYISCQLFSDKFYCASHYFPSAACNSQPSASTPVVESRFTLSRSIDAVHCLDLIRTKGLICCDVKWSGDDYYEEFVVIRGTRKTDQGCSLSRQSSAIIFGVH